MNFTSSPRPDVARLPNGARSGTSRRLGVACAALLAAAVAPLHAAAAAPAPVSNATLLERVGPGSPVSVQNYRAFLPSLYAVANARPLETAYVPTQKTLKALNAALDGSGDSRFVALSASATTTRFACPRGGIVTVSRTGSVADGNASMRASFARCGIDGARLDGAVTWIGANADGSGTEFTTFGRVDGVSSKAFSYTEKSGFSTIIDGYRTDSRGMDDFERELAWNADWTLRRGSATLTVTGMRLAAARLASGYSYQSDFEMNGKLTDGMRVPVATFAPFHTDYGPDFVSGYMQVLVLDGPASAAGRLAISAAADGTGEFGVTVDTYGTPGNVQTTNVRIPQSEAGGPLKLGAK